MSARDTARVEWLVRFRAARRLPELHASLKGSPAVTALIRTGT